MKRKKIKLLFVLLICTVLINSTNIYAQKESYVSRYDFVTRICDPAVCNVELVCDEHLFRAYNENIYYINPDDDFLDSIEYDKRCEAVYIDMEKDDFSVFLAEYKPDWVMLRKEECTEKIIKQLKNESYYEIKASENENPENASLENKYNLIGYHALELPRSKFKDIKFADYPWVVDCDVSVEEVNASSYHSSINETAARFMLAESTGLLYGCGDDNFNPRDSITREDMAVIIYRMLKNQNITIVGGNPFDLPMPTYSEKVLMYYSDGIEVSPYAREAVSILLQMGLLTEYKNNEINPKGYITEEQVERICIDLGNILDDYGTKSKIYMEDYGQIIHSKAIS